MYFAEERQPERPRPPALLLIAGRDVTPDIIDPAIKITALKRARNVVVHRSFAKRLPIVAGPRLGQ